VDTLALTVPPAADRIRAVKKPHPHAAPRARTDRWWLIGILGVGLAIRLPSLWTVGYAPDIAFWKSWLSFATANGIQNVYALEMPGQTYPPVFLYLLWALGLLYRGIWPNAGDSAWLTAFVKFPAVAADLVAAAILAAYAGRRAASPVGPGRSPGSVRGGGFDPRVAAALFALNPVLIWLSSYWGQVDVLHGGLAAGAWGAALAGAPALAGILLVLGVLVKPQGLLVLPAAAALLARRTGGRGLARAVVAGAAVGAVVTAPFIISGYGGRLVGIYAGAGDVYPYVSVNAFNPWWCVTVLRPHGISRPLMSDAITLAGPLTLRALGLVLFALASAWIVWRVARAERPDADPSRAWRLLTLQWMAFFLLATQVHERYLVPAILSFAPAVVLDRRWLVPWLALTGAILLNILYVVPGWSGVASVVRVISGQGILAAVVLCVVTVVLVRAEVRA